MRHDLCTLKYGYPVVLWMFRAVFNKLNLIWSIEHIKKDGWSVLKPRDECFKTTCDERGAGPTMTLCWTKCFIQYIIKFSDWSHKLTRKVFKEIMFLRLLHPLKKEYRFKIFRHWLTGFTFQTWKLCPSFAPSMIWTQRYVEPRCINCGGCLLGFLSYLHSYLHNVTVMDARVKLGKSFN